MQRWKSTFKREPFTLRRLFAGRVVFQKRVFLLAPLLLGLMFVAVTEPGGQAFSQAVGKKIIAALKDPLALFAQRSPGRRSSARHLIKIKGRPHERVLSTVRERPAPEAGPLLETPPTVLDIPPEAVAPIPAPLPAIQTRPEAPIFNTPFVTPFFPIGFPGGPPGGPSTPTPPGSPPGLPPESPPFSPPLTPPGSTPPGTISIPEPAPWTMMGFGFLAVAATARRHTRKQRAQSR